MFELIYTSRKQLNFGDKTPDAFGLCYFVPWWDGLLFRPASSSGNWYRVYPDGTQLFFSNESMATPFTYSSKGEIYGSYRISETFLKPFLYPFRIDYFTLLGDPVYDEPVVNLRLNSVWPDIHPWMPDQVSYPYFDLAKQWFLYVQRYYENGYKVRLVKRSLTDGTVLQEIPVNLPAANFIFSQILIRYVSPSRVILLPDYPKKTSSDETWNRVSLVDYYEDRIISEGRIGRYWFAEFWPKYQLIMTVNPDRKIQLFTLNAQPAILSNPEFVSGPPRVGGLYKVRVRLTGSDGEACKDYIIHWEVPEAKGRLRRLVSATGDDGYAYNYYLAPDAPTSARITTWVVV